MDCSMMVFGSTTNKMSRILAISAASDFSSVAISNAGEIHCKAEKTQRGHGDHLLNMISSVLAESVFDKNSIDAVAFACGPGAFTSLRLAAGITQGFAVGIDRPVVPVSSLAAIAHGVFRHRQSQHTLVALDARMNQVYFAAFNTVELSNTQAVTDEQVCDPADLCWPEGKQARVGIGWEVYANKITPSSDHQYLGAGGEDAAIDVAYLATKAMHEGNVYAPEQALPVYIRDQVAHQNR